MTDKLFISLSIEQQEAVFGGATNNTFSNIPDIADSIISGITANTGLFPGLSYTEIVKLIFNRANAAIPSLVVPTIPNVP